MYVLSVWEGWGAYWSGSLPGGCLHRLVRCGLLVIKDTWEWVRWMVPTNILWDLKRRDAYPLLIVLHHRGEQNECIIVIPYIFVCMCAYLYISISLSISVCMLKLRFHLFPIYPTGGPIWELANLFTKHYEMLHRAATSTVLFLTVSLAPTTMLGMHLVLR